MHEILYMHMGMSVPQCNEAIGPIKLLSYKIIPIQNFMRIYQSIKEVCSC